MKTDQSNEDTFLNHLVSWLNKHAADNETLKKSKSSSDKKPSKEKEIGIQEAVVLLTDSLTKCMQEITKITTSLTSVIKAVNEHSSMIEEIYTVQAGILQLLKMNVNTSTTVDAKSSEAAKKKTEKPN